MSKKYKNLVLPGITIEKAAAEGKCVAKWDEQVVFVEGVAPGDVADIRIIRKKKNYLEAIPLDILEPSSLRTEPFCYHFGTCGGCKWQHIAYDHQLEFKRQQVVDNLQRIAKIDFPEVSPTLPSPLTQYHRNKLEFTFSNYRWLEAQEIASGEEMDRQGLGFHKPRQFDKVVDIKTCYLQPEPSNAIRLWIKTYAVDKGLNFYDIRKKEGFLRNLVIRTASSGELMVILQVGTYLKDELQALLTSLQEAFPEITSLNYVVNNKGNETFYDLEVVNFSGKDHIIEQMEALQFRVGPKSFYQTNPQQALNMYRLVRDLAQLKGQETVFDLYSGTGTIALFLASQVSEVVAIEQVPEAVEDARTNAKVNGIENAHFYTGDLKDVFRGDMLDGHGHCDVLITDPPRAGMHEEVIYEIAKLGPSRIVYVSCNPATQARDLALMDPWYQIESVHPLDMFPHTHHVESVVSLTKRN